MAFCNQNRRWFNFMVILILVGLTSSVRGIRRQNVYAKVYIEDQCTEKENITYLLRNSGLASAVKIEATRRDYLSPDRNCTITITPPLGHGVFLNVESFYFGSYYHTTKDCSEYLEVLGNFGNATRLCGYHKEALHFTTRGSMTLHYRTDSNGLGTGFSLVATVFRSVDYFWCGQDEYFKCANNRCIWRGFTCDGVNNCEDNSDEKSTSFAICAEVERFTLRPINIDWDTFYPTSNFPNFRESTNITVGAAVCSAFILMFAVAVRFYCYYQCAQARRRSFENRIAIIRTRTDFMPSLSVIAGANPPPYTSLVNAPEGRLENPPAYSSCLDPAQPSSGTNAAQHDMSDKPKPHNDVAQPTEPSEPSETRDLPPPYAP